MGAAPKLKERDQDVRRPGRKSRLDEIADILVTALERADEEERNSRERPPSSD